MEISGYRNKPVIVREVAKVIDMLRYVGIVDSFTETAGNYTIVSAKHGLKAFDVITLNSVDYVVNVTDENTFVFSGFTGIDFDGFQWKAKGPYYLFGHPLDIVNVLAEKNKGGIYQYQKYPLIALFQDFEEDIINEGTQASLNIIIANRTKPTYHADERYKLNFEPVLYPILEQFERALQVSRHVALASVDYNKTDRLYWGKNGLYGNTGNIFNDHIDAIEINNLQLTFKNICK
jgi:hypothetical protein